MPENHSANNKRIAKNTAFLYVRMIFVMFIMFYASRVVLRALGVVDYGVYNVVGGVVVMLAFITGPMTAAVSRFITFTLGKGDEAELRKVVGTLRSVLLLLALLILLLAETVGLWFVMTQLVIPPERMTAAFWVYQCSVATSIITVLSMPYMAMVIAHEHMNTYAVVSIVESVAKLGAALLLLVLDADHLIFYGVFLLTAQVMIRIVYTLYCRKHFSESRAPLTWNRPLLRDIGSYCGWAIGGNLAVVGYTQGLNILLNLFFGPAVNAARGVAVQVQTAAGQLCTNFQMAIRPQITKNYANGDLEYMHKLMMYSTKYSFYLMLLVVIPVVVNAPFILHVWLGNVPDHTAEFIRITMLVALIESVKEPLLAAIHATGKLRVFQSAEGILLLTIPVIAYVGLKWGHISPETVFWIYFCVEAITQIVRVRIVLPRVGLAYGIYLRKAMCPVLLVLVVSSPTFLLSEMPDGWTKLLFSLSVIFLWLGLTIFFIGMGQTERTMVTAKLRTIFHFRRNCV